MSHQIRPGETLSSLAARYGTSVSALLTANPQIKNANVIQAGATLQLPGQRDSFGPAVSAAAAATAAVTYDGNSAASGTTNTNAAYPAAPPVRGNPGMRNASTYDNVINEFAVGTNPRYAQRDGNTYCNIFAWDVTRAMGAEIPHWVDNAGHPQPYNSGHEMDANSTNQWLNQHGAAYGWRPVSAAEAQRLANQGFPTVASLDQSPDIGHIGVVRPGSDNGSGPALAQAGATNTNHSHVYDHFPRSGTQFFVNDKGTAVGGSAPPPPGPTPTVTAPAANLQYDGGSSYSADVEQLQRALVKVGMMSQSEMDGGPGHYGPLTRAAVNRVQQQAGITGNGGEDYGPRTRAALQTLLEKSGPAKKVPAGSATRAARDAQTAKKIDGVLAGYSGSRMQGMGSVIIAACRKEHVPVDLLMAQLAKESTFLRSDNTLSIANNNPGNLRHAGWESQFGGTPGQGGFEHFPSIQAGIQAYAHLMGSRTLPYRAMVDARDWKGLVHTYAPASDGNDEAQYVRELTDWMRMFGGKIGVDSNWVNEK